MPRGSRRIARMATLFSEDALLADGVRWLLGQHLRELEGRPGAAELKRAVLRLLNDGLLPDDHFVEEIDSEGLWIVRDGHKIAFSEVSDGYRTVTALVLDLLRHMTDAFEGLTTDVTDEGVPVVTAPGVVLIDEVEAHLHISWQKRIGPWLKAHFPNIQFIVTTHSPYICQAADRGGLIRLPGPGDREGPQVVSDDLWERVVYGSGDDAVLSEIFGIDSTYSLEAQRLRRELVLLEVKVIKDEADAAELARYDDLRRTLTSSLLTRSREISTGISLLRQDDTE